MKIEALCVAGGETYVNSGSWKKEGEEVVLIQSLANGLSAERGLCIKPKACVFANRCTGKVIFSEAEESGFSKAIIHMVVFPNMEIPMQIAKEDECVL